MDRRSFLAAGAALPTVVALGSQVNLRADEVSTKGAEKLGWKLALQTWTNNKKSLFESLELCKRLGVKYAECYPGQALEAGKKPGFGPGMSEAEIERTLAKAKDCGVTILHAGVMGLPGKIEEARKIFTWAKKIGLTIINSEPDPKDLAVIDQAAGEAGLKVGIHDHPKPSRYWDPEYVISLVKDLKHVGMCADVGHWVRSGLSPKDVLTKHGKHVVSSHFKDMAKGGGPNGYHDVVWTTGMGDVPGMLKALKDAKFQGVFSIEFEWEWKEETLAGCVKNFHKTADELA